MSPFHRLSESCVQSDFGRTCKELQSRRTRLNAKLTTSYPDSSLRVMAGTITVPVTVSASTRGDKLMRTNRCTILALLLALLGVASAQQASRHMLSNDELKKAVPTEFFYRGQKAPVQLRNAVGFQQADGKMTLAALVDASGYSTAIQQKYQGMLVTELKLDIGGSTLPPGQYGFGFTSDGKFMVMDVSNHDVLSTSYETDQALQRAVPLKLVEDGSGYKLYAGKKWIEIKVE
jgi:hypothetical protein